MFSLSSLESWANVAETLTDEIAPLVEPMVPEAAIAIPIVNGLDQLLKMLAGSGNSLVPAVAAKVAASQTQLATAIATPAKA